LWEVTDIFLHPNHSFANNYLYNKAINNGMLTTVTAVVMIDDKSTRANNVSC